MRKLNALGLAAWLLGFYVCLSVIGASKVAAASKWQEPLVSSKVVWEEQDELLAVEAEHFYKQSLNDKRAWYRTSSAETAKLNPDGDPAHVGGASGGAYLENLPDTSGTVWRAHLSPDKPGRWDYEVSFATGKHFAVNLTDPGKPLAPFDGVQGQFTIAPTDKSSVDFRGKERDNSKYCFAQAGELYLVYLPSGGSSNLNLKDATGSFGVQWFNPREGRALTAGTITEVVGGTKANLGQPPIDPKEDWLVVVRRQGN